MKKIILNNKEYSFDASERKVELTSDKYSFNAESLLLITNVTTNTIIYNFGCEGFGGVINSTSSYITLDFDTTLMSDSDNLQIVMYTESNPQDNALLLMHSQMKSHLQCLQEILDAQNKTNNILNKIYN